ncbi:PEP-CTERM protein-sorting domain-containing protein [Terrimicrobium sacchariphilum]|uniref:PEP-CTERM protein-sorting domain-containing protein n=1 Tax=Terrimicrobium sacchariphilum TaxID=690879 RepID=A0A146G191_TERSA|nr:autotransporter-associated beta strand repeat-containing protein [Terrimicrobium sacchariphilum]GAT31471.1 PEP-CTERM protein-sorting domain-containing protein [Terrimicrobium sacchariphilum]
MKTTVFPYKLLAAVSTLLLPATVPLYADLYTAGSGNWSLGTNWNTGTAPNGVGAVASRNGGASVTITQDLSSVTLGTLSLTGSTSTVLTVSLSQLSGTPPVPYDWRFDQDGSGAGVATIENASTAAGSRIVLQNAGGAMFLDDDLVIKQSNANSTASASGDSYAIQINQRLVGTKSITVNNALNDLNYGMVAFQGGTTGKGSYTGAITLASGALTWTSTTAFGSASGITLGSTGGGSVSFVTSRTVASVGQAITVASGTGGTTVLGSTLTTGTQNFGGAITLNQDLTVVSQMTTADTAGVVLGGVVSGSGNLQINGNVKYSGVSTDTAGIVKLTGNNTFTGQTRVYKGSLLLGAASGTNSLALQNSTLNLASGDTGTVGFGVTSATTITSATVGGLSGTRDLSLQNIATSSAAVALSVGNNNSDTTYDGALTGSGSLTKIGTGTLTLGGHSTYTGATTISSGTLLLASGGNIASSSSVKVNGASARLAGSGLASNITLTAGSISPGNGGIGTLSAASLAWNGGASMVFNLSATDNTSDLLALTGALTKVGSGAYTFDFSGGFSYGQTYTLITFGSSSGFSASDFSTTGQEGTFNLTGSSLTFTAVPEPATWTLVAAGLCCTIFLRRRS